MKGVDEDQQQINHTAMTSSEKYVRTPIPLPASDARAFRRHASIASCEVSSFLGQDPVHCTVLHSVTCFHVSHTVG